MIPSAEDIATTRPHTIVYVDGFNLYYGSGKGTQYKWLNLEAVCHTLLPGDQIVKIRCFTARVNGRPDDPQLAGPARERGGRSVRQRHQAGSGGGWNERGWYRIVVMVLNAGLKSSPWIACRPVATPEDIDDPSITKADGIVQFPLHLDWSHSGTFDLDNEHQRRWLLNLAWLSLRCSHTA